MDWKGVKGTVLEKVPMKRYTSMRVGGPARFMIYPVDGEDLGRVIGILAGKGIPYRFLGNGTNVIVHDAGIDEALIRVTKMRWLRYEKTGDTITVDVAAGMSLKSFIADNARRGLSGLEKLYWIPGTVGGAVKMNAGSFGSSVSDTLAGITFAGPEGLRTVTRDEMSFGYRRSAVMPSQCVLGARFTLSSRAREDIRADMDYVFTERKKRHPMEYPSAGSVFKAARGEPAWKYIERAGLKGYRIGDACVSEKHANFIVNLGAAKARHVRELIEKIKSEVFEKAGVVLEEEVELWGFHG